MDDEPAYLVRYGLMGRVGKFAIDPGSVRDPERGQSVVIRTDRGLELGEVLARVAVPPSTRPAEGRGTKDGEDPPPPSSTASDPGRPGLLRVAGPADLERARELEPLRHERFAECRRILEEGSWPLELLDVEPLLDASTTVLHVLGPPDLDLSLLRARFRSVSRFDILFESVGSESTREEAVAAEPAARTGRCGDCDCSGGGCGSGASTSAPAQATRAEEQKREPSPSSCDTSHHSACSSCGVSQWRSRTRHGAD